MLISDRTNGLKRCWGFPINVTLKSLDDLRKEVVNTKIHTVNKQDVEFALSVYIESYPCNVLSVWVFLAAYVDNTESFKLNNL